MQRALAGAHLFEQAVTKVKPIAMTWDTPDVIGPAAIEVKMIDGTFATGTAGAGMADFELDCAALGEWRDLDEHDLNCWSPARPLKHIAVGPGKLDFWVVCDEFHRGPYFRSAAERAQDLRWQAARLGRRFRRPLVLLDRSKLRGGKVWTTAEWQRRGYDVSAMVDDAGAFEGATRTTSPPAARLREAGSEHCRGPGREPDHLQGRRLLLSAERRGRGEGRHRWPAACSTPRCSGCSHRKSKVSRCSPSKDSAFFSRSFSPSSQS
jgi:hypothetical protein